MLCKRVSTIASLGLRALASYGGSALKITKTKSPKAKIPAEKLVFGKYFTDHMLMVDFTRKDGWKNARIEPYQNLSLDPACCVFHYGIEVFEGMKAYIDPKGHARLFRPDLNIKRMNRGLERLAMPPMIEKDLLECIEETVRLEKSWIPKKFGYTLYLRPTVIGTQNSLGVHATDKAKFFMIMCPVGPYYPTGFKPVKLWAETEYVRAWPGGTGSIKCGGNYACSLAAQEAAAKKGFSQNLWLFGPEKRVTEVGAMNMFFALKSKAGKRELITPSLKDGTILPGVTRQSIVELAKEMPKDIDAVVERDITIDEITEACDDGRIMEAFGSGTAAIVSPVELIQYNNKAYKIPTDPVIGLGKIAEKIHARITDIQYGKVDHPWSVLID